MEYQKSQAASVNNMNQLQITHILYSDSKHREKHIF
jgi:hypothetical protein